MCIVTAVHASGMFGHGSVLPDLFYHHVSGSLCRVKNYLTDGLKSPMLPLQKFHPATPENFQRCWHADFRAAMFLQVCNRPGPSGADVQISQEHVFWSSGHRRGATRQDASLR